MIVKVDVSAKGTFEIYLDEEKLTDVYGRAEVRKALMQVYEHLQRVQINSVEVVKAIESE